MIITVSEMIKLQKYFVNRRSAEDQARAKKLHEHICNVVDTITFGEEQHGGGKWCPLRERWTAKELEDSCCPDGCRFAPCRASTGGGK